MSQLSEKLQQTHQGEGRAGATIEQLRDRRQRVGVAEVDQALFDRDPPEIMIRAPSQTEWWVRVARGKYQLARAVSECEPLPVTP